MEMDKIGIMQLDGKIPNLALMKIAGYHENIGDTVEWYNGGIFSNEYKVVYASKLFSFTPTPQLPENAVIGGTGIDFYNKLPLDIENATPSYSIYPYCDYHLGKEQKMTFPKIKTNPCIKKSTAKKAAKAVRQIGETMTVEAYKKEVKKPKISNEIHLMKACLDLYDIPYEAEFMFAKPRKWRFDLALPAHKIALEYEGIYGRGKSRHTTVTGYSGDIEKYNRAAILGWKVLRYTAKTYKNFMLDLKQLIIEN